MLNFAATKSKGATINDSNEETNPFAAPQKTIETAMSTDRILQRGLLMVFASTVMFGLMGAIVGGLIGVFLPDYYYAMIPSIRNGGGSTWQLGIGLGLTQGAIGGALIGVILVVSTAFYKSRMRNSVAAMVAQMQALQSTSPQVDVVDEVDLASLTKTKSSAKTE